MMSFSLPFSQILICLLLGGTLAGIYLVLLWLTVINLPKIKHKALFLLFSTILRLAVFIGLALLFSQHNLVRFLYIFIAFVMARLIIVGCIKSRRLK